MPIIKADWAAEKKLSQSEKKDFIEFTVNCVASAIKVPDHVINVMIREIPMDNVRFPAVVLTIAWSRHENRNRDAKAEITERLTERILELTGVDADKIVVFFLDLEGENVGVAGQIKG